MADINVTDRMGGRKVEFARGGGRPYILLIKRCLTELWFLWAVFFCVLTVLFTEILFKDKWKLIFLAIFEGAIILLPDIFNSKMYKFMLPFFVAGYMGHKYRIKVKIADSRSSRRWILTGVLLLLWILTLAGYNQDTYIYTSGITLYGKNTVIQLLTDSVRFLAGFAGTGFILLLVDSMYHIVQMRKTNRILSLIGEKSMGIYILNHYININILLRITAHCNNCKILQVLWMSALVVTACYGLTVFLQKFKITNIIFLGGKP